MRLICRKTWLIRCPFAPAETVRAQRLRQTPPERGLFALDVTTPANFVENKADKVPKKDWLG